MTEAQKISYPVQISRGQAIEYGLVEPTSDELAWIREYNAKWNAWQDRQDERHQLAAEALRSAGELEQRLVDLHSPNDYGECGGCDFGGYEGEPPTWPCRTVALLAEHRGLQLEEPMPNA